MEDDFPEIKTGNGIDRDLAATANDRIKKAVIEIRKFTSTVETFNNQSFKQTRKLINLTWWIVGLTIILVIGLILQIWLNIK